ncbi:MAG: RNA polymerase sigma factor [Pirellulaceae bacterium]
MNSFQERVSGIEIRNGMKLLSSLVFAGRCSSTLACTDRFRDAYVEQADSTSITLLQGLKTSDEASWNRFLNLYTPMIFRWGKSLGLDEAASEDLTQDVLTKLITWMREFHYDRNRSF